MPLNAGLNFCYTPIFCAMDADSILEPQALIRIVRPFLEDASTVAAGGILRIANGCKVEQGRVTEVGCPTTCSRSYRSWSTCASSWPVGWAGRRWTRR